MTTPLWAWVATCAGIVALLAGDMAAGARGPGTGVRRALASSAGWIAISLLFGVLIGATRGWGDASQYYSAYLLEKMLSVDNVFAFALIFASVGVPSALQRRVLQWGVIGALVLRAGFIAAGTTLVEDVSWALSLFGVVVLVAGVRMLRGGEIRPERSLAVRALRALVPVSDELDDNRFLTRRTGRLQATPLLVALVAVEATDVILAGDSIPAVFGVTTDPFLVFTSNAFAVLGLRALYLVLAAAIERFAVLTRAIAVLLVLIGIKLLLHDVVTVPPVLNLVLIAVVLGAGATIEVLRRRHAERAARALR